jgi:hypothetical protein
MPLYTVVVSFIDRTNGIEQYNSSSPNGALTTFIRNAQSLKSYPKDGLEKLIGGGDSITLIHVADDLRGFWIWVPVQGSDPRTEAVLGGYIIQTDTNAPRRGEVQ